MGISDFSEYIVSETGSDSGGNSHDGSKSDTDSEYNPEPFDISNFFILQSKRAEL